MDYLEHSSCRTKHSRLLSPVKSTNGDDAVDPFTQKRMAKFVEDYRQKSGQLPTIRDFEAAGFDRTTIDSAIKMKLIEEFYVTLTSGTIVKTYKVRKF